MEALSRGPHVSEKEEQDPAVSGTKEGGERECTRCCGARLRGTAGPQGDQGAGPRSKGHQAEGR